MEIHRLLSLFLFSCYLSLLFALFGDTFHLYQPTWAAYPCLHDDVWYLWIELLHHLFYCVVIRNVTEIDDEILDVVHRGLAIFQQGTDVLQESSRLSDNVSLIYYVSMLVDAGSARYEKHLFVG